MKASQYPDEPLGQKLLQSLGEALAYARGDAQQECFRVHVIPHTETPQPAPNSLKHA